MTKRAINVSGLNKEQLEIAVGKISDTITSEVDMVCEKVNGLLKRYGMRCKMQIVIEELAAENKAAVPDKIEQEATTQ